MSASGVSTSFPVRLKWGAKRQELRSLKDTICRSHIPVPCPSLTEPGTAPPPIHSFDSLQNHVLQDVSSKNYDRWNYMPEMHRVRGEAWGPDAPDCLALSRPMGGRSPGLCRQGCNGLHHGRSAGDKGAARSSYHPQEPAEAEIAYGAETDNGLLREAAFKGLVEESQAPARKTPKVARTSGDVPKENILQLLRDAVVPSKEELVGYWTRVADRALGFPRRPAIDRSPRSRRRCTSCASRSARAAKEFGYGWTILPASSAWSKSASSRCTPERRRLTT